MRIGDSQFNRLQVLRALRRLEPVSRTELAAATGLNAATISHITGDLVARGIVIEEKLKSAGAGRPRLNLRLNAKSHYTVCAVIVPGQGLRIGIVDLRGEIVFSTFTELVRTGDVGDLAHRISRHIAEVIAGSGIARAAILNVAIGLPAVVDRRTGIVHYFETFDPVPVDVRAIVEAELGLPASIDNSNNLLASCEYWYGNDAASDDFILLFIDLGIASTIYRDGLLQSGRHGFEPEVGHSKLFATGGRRCRCGACGCLEAYASMAAIIDHIEPLDSRDYIDVAALYERFDRLAFASGQPTAAAAPLLAQAGAVLGTAVANLVNVEDPERVVILITNQAFAEALRPDFEVALRRDTWSTLRDRVTVEFKPHTSDMYLRGAAALTLERFYEPRLP